MKQGYSLSRGAKAAAFLLGCISLLNAGQALGVEFELTFTEKVRKTPFTGRVVLFFCPNDKPIPRSWDMISRDPVASIDVQDWKPGDPIRVRNARAHPVALEKLEGVFQVCAVMQTNTTVPYGLNAAGALRSGWHTVVMHPDDATVKALQVTRRVKPEKQRPPISGAVEVSTKSKLLSDFHGRDVLMRAWIDLPEGYESSKARQYPAIYYIPGFGGDHHQALQYAAMLGEPDVPFVRVGLDPNLHYGHHVFADSDNNGPCARALIEEFIPYLEGKYRLIAEPRGRYLVGHSSGGWSSLWLQISYPDFFNGAWAGSPDPIDFHDFTGIDLYDANANFFTDANGHDRPIMRRDGNVLYTIREFARQEDVIGPGGQLYAFEAVFGPRGKSGRPAPLYDRESGRIDRDVFKAWQRYDITARLEREWKSIGPRLRGKITVIMGEADNFYLEGAARHMKQTLKALGSDARVHMVPGADHGTVFLSPEYRAVIGEIEQRFRKTHDE